MTVELFIVSTFGLSLFGGIALLWWSLSLLRHSFARLGKPRQQPAPVTATIVDLQPVAVPAPIAVLPAAHTAKTVTIARTQPIAPPAPVRLSDEDVSRIARAVVQLTASAASVPSVLLLRLSRNLRPFLLNRTLTL